MSIALIVLRDGRDSAHQACMESAALDLPMRAFDQVIEIDDRDHELGFAGAIAKAWEQVTTSWVFHLEADFTFNRPVPLHHMIGVLQRHPELAQLVLKRQPCNPLEEAVGGIVEQHPDDYLERRCGADVWTEHRKFWSTNPSVYSSRWCRIGWPQEPQSEGMFTHKLLADPLLRFGFWGPKHGAPVVHHIGVRAGIGY